MEDENKGDTGDYDAFSGDDQLANDQPADADISEILIDDGYQEEFLPEQGFLIENETEDMLFDDLPDAFDTDLLCAHIRELKAGRRIEMPVYDYSVHNRSDKTTPVLPNPVIILEGILIFAEPELVDLMDFRIFVDTDADERILRRIKRDVNERGRSLESVMRQYRETVKPMHDQFVEPSKRKANIIIPEGGRNQAAMQMVVDFITNRLR